MHGACNQWKTSLLRSSSYHFWKAGGENLHICVQKLQVWVITMMMLRQEGDEQQFGTEEIITRKCLWWVYFCATCFYPSLCFPLTQGHGAINTSKSKERKNMNKQYNRSIVLQIMSCGVTTDISWKVRVFPKWWEEEERRKNVSRGVWKKTWWKTGWDSWGFPYPFFPC